MKLHSVVVAALALSVFGLAGGCAGMRTASSPQADSGVRGRVLVKGVGAAGAYVYAYTSAVNDLRGPTALVSSQTAADGTYQLGLPPGTYYLAARKRASGSPTGNLGEGDLEGMSKANPVVVTKGAYAPVDLPMAELNGKFLLSPYRNVQGDMGITGRVLKGDGTPMSGAYVMVYTRRDRTGRPAFLSSTNEAGEYSVYPSKAGTYYVAARGSYGDLPRKGEPYGTYDLDPEHKVDLKEKVVLTGVDIKMDKFTRDLTKCAEH